MAQPAKPPRFTNIADHAAYCREQAFGYLDAGKLNSAISSVVANLLRGPFKPTPAARTQLTREGPTLAEMKDIAQVRAIIMRATEVSF